MIPFLKPHDLLLISAKQEIKLRDLAVMGLF
jgi:hypothetical protein